MAQTALALFFLLLLERFFLLLLALFFLCPFARFFLWPFDRFFLCPFARLPPGSRMRRKLKFMQKNSIAPNLI